MPFSVTKSGDPFTCDIYGDGYSSGSDRSASVTVYLFYLSVLHGGELLARETGGSLQTLCVQW